MFCFIFITSIHPLLVAFSEGHLTVYYFWLLLWVPWQGVLPVCQQHGQIPLQHGPQELLLHWLRRCALPGFWLRGSGSCTDGYFESVENAKLLDAYIFFAGACFWLLSVSAHIPISITVFEYCVVFPVLRYLQEDRWFVDTWLELIRWSSATGLESHGLRHEKVFGYMTSVSSMSQDYRYNFMFHGLLISPKSHSSIHPLCAPNKTRLFFPWLKSPHMCHRQNLAELLILRDGDQSMFIDIFRYPWCLDSHGMRWMTILNPILFPAYSYHFPIIYPCYTQYPLVN